MRNPKRTPEDLDEVAGRALGLALIESRSLVHSANAGWPPPVTPDIQGSIPTPPAANVKPAREEWDFRAKLPAAVYANSAPFSDLVDAEVLPCFEYERSREDKGWVQQADAWREGCPDKTFGGFLAFWCQRWRAGKKPNPCTEFYLLWPEWPVLPYLLIPATVRRKRLELWTGRKFRAASKPKQVDWEETPLGVLGIPYLFSKHEIICDKPAWYKGELEDAIFGETITFSGEKHALWKTREYVAFDLDWLESNEQIVERFREWVERHREQNGIKPRELRGAASYSKEMRSNLIALGAWRLVNKFKFSIADAHSHTETLSGKALYANPETWLRNLTWITSPMGMLWGAPNS